MVSSSSSEELELSLETMALARDLCAYVDGFNEVGHGTTTANPAHEQDTWASTRHLSNKAEGTEGTRLP